MTANSTIALAKIILQRDRFGPTTLKELPMDGITGAIHHNIEAATDATRVYRVGEICTVWHRGDSPDSIKGFTEFVYGRFDHDTDAVTAIREVVQPSVITNLFDFGDDVDQVACGGFGVVTISLMTDNYYGWFWSGGVAPIDFVNPTTLIADDFAATDTVITNGDVVAMTGFYAVKPASGNDPGLGVCGAGLAQMGTALAAD